MADKTINSQMKTHTGGVQNGPTAGAPVLAESLCATPSAQDTMLSPTKTLQPRLRDVRDRSFIQSLARSPARSWGWGRQLQASNGGLSGDLLPPSSPPGHLTGTKGTSVPQEMPTDLKAQGSELGAESKYINKAAPVP